MIGQSWFVVESTMDLKRFTLSALVLFGLVWAVCLAPKIIDQALPGYGYNDTYHTASYRAQLIRNVWSANFPDLAPGIYMGQPLLSTGQAAMLYPSNLLGILIPVSALWFYLFDLWLHATLASAGMAWMLRRRGHTVLTSLMLGWVYANSSVFLLRAALGHWELLHQVALFPWVLGIWEGMARARPQSAGKWALAWGGIWGVLLLTRNPQVLLAMLVVLVPLEIWRMISRRGRMPVLDRLALLSGSVIIAAFIGAAALTPHLDGVGESYRALMAGVHTGTSWPWLPFNTVGLISSKFLFGETANVYLGNWYAHESTAMVPWGVTALAVGGAVAAFGRRRFPRGGEAALPWALIAGGVIIGMAGAMPWGEWMSEHVPLFGFFRAWGRASVLAILGLIMLAAGGLDALTDHRTRLGKARIANFAGVALCLLICLWGLISLTRQPAETLATLGQFHLSGYPYGDNSELIPTLGDHLLSVIRADLLWYSLWLMVIGPAVVCGRGRLRVVVAVGCGLLLALGALSQQRFHWEGNTRPNTPETQPEVAAWLAEMHSETAPAPVTVILRADDLSTFGLQIEGIRSVMGTDSNVSRTYVAWLNRSFGLLVDSYALNPFEIRSVPPRVIAETGARARLDFASTSYFNSAWTQVGDHAIEEFPQAPPYAQVLDDAASLEVVSWNEDAAVIEVTAPSATTVIVREFPRPNWRILVNGEGWNPEFGLAHLEIPVPAGSGRIELKYVDMPARIGVLVSLVAGLVVVFIGLMGLIRMRRTA